MFVRCKTRRKDGKEHRYWSVVENVRVRGGRVVQRQVLYLGEINDSQRTAWWRTIEVLEGKSGSRQMALFPQGREAPALNCEVVRVQVQDVEVHAPRQWGACWLTLCLWERLELDRFWGPRLPASRQGTRWLDIVKVLVCYRLIDPGSEWRLHRQWYEHSALRDLLGCDRVLASNTLYRCLDKLVVHKEAFFSFLHERWTRLFDARFDVLLYDLTSTYFESDPPFEDKRQIGYSRDKRSDCVQVVIALIVTPDGFPLAYEVMPGNTSDNTTLAGFVEKIEKQYGRSDRVPTCDLLRLASTTVRQVLGGWCDARVRAGLARRCLVRRRAALRVCAALRNASRPMEPQPTPNLRSRNLDPAYSGATRGQARRGDVQAGRCRQRLDGAAPDQQHRARRPRRGACACVRRLSARAEAAGTASNRVDRATNVD